MSFAKSPSLPAGDRALSLLADPPANPDRRNGYLDLIGDDAAGADSVSQRLMTSRAYPLIYERWRTIGLGVALGAVGARTSVEDPTTQQYLELGAGDVVLDVACGPGNISRRLGTHVGQDGLVVGIDASPTMLARAVQDTDAPNISFVRGDAQRLPFADASFDAVCCYAALYLFDNPFGAISEMVRVLAPGGRIAILTSLYRGLPPLEPATKLAGKPFGFRVFGRDEVTGAFAAAGLVDVRQRIAGLAQYVGARAPDAV